MVGTSSPGLVRNVNTGSIDYKYFNESAIEHPRNVAYVGCQTGLENVREAE